MINLNRLKELEMNIGLFPWAEHFRTIPEGNIDKELRNALPDIIRELEAGRKLEDEISSTGLAGHPRVIKASDDCRKARRGQ